MTSSDYQEQFFSESIRLLADELRMPESEVDLSQNALDFGLDSIMVTTFIEELNEKFSIDIDPMSIFEYDTLDELLTFLYTDNAEAIGQVYAQ